MNNYVSVEEVIKSLLIQQGEYTEHKYMQYLDIALRGLKELAFDVTQEVKAKTLPVNENLTVDLPSDYVDYVRIGVCNNGVIRDLSKYLGSCLSRATDECGAPIAKSSGSDTRDLDNIEDIYWFSNYRGGENMGRIYGVGGGQSDFGYYRIDTERNQISLASPFAGGSIYLEYIGDGSGDNGQYDIHVHAEEALRAYIWWKSIQRKRMIPMNEKEMARRDWYNEKRLAIARFSNFTKQEALQQSRKNFKQTPKM